MCWACVALQPSRWAGLFTDVGHHMPMVVVEHHVFQQRIRRDRAFGGQVLYFSQGLGPAP